MLSLTRDDMPKFAFSDPDDVRSTSEKALNIWVGAMSPLWAPFIWSTGIGVGFWAMTQGYKRFGEAVRTAPDAIGTLVSNTRKTDVAGTVQNMVQDGLIAPIQTMGNAVSDVATAATPSPEVLADQIKADADKATTTTTQVLEKTADAVTQAADDTTASVTAAADIAADTGSVIASDVASTAQTETKTAVDAMAGDGGAAASDLPPSTASALRRPRKS